MGNKIEIKTALLNSRNYMLCGLIFIATGLSVSKPLISLGVIFLFFSWIVDGKIVEKFNRFKKNKTALVLCSLYLISVLGLIHSSDYAYGLDDVRKKLSIFFIPFLVMGFQPLTKREFSFLLKVYVGWVVFSCFWSFCVYFGVIDEVIVDKRDYSRYNSHIRFGLEIAMAIFILCYFFKNSPLKKHKIVSALTVLFLGFTLYFFSFVTGILVLSITTILLLFVFGVFSKNKRKRWLSISMFSALIIAGILFIKSSVEHFYSLQEVEPLKEKIVTKQGNKYRKDQRVLSNHQKENGYLIEHYVADKEFEEAWNKRAKIKYHKEDLKGHPIKFTLRRFVTSKGLYKDAEGIDQLSDKEIAAIEKGVSNYLYLNMTGLRVRAHKIIWEYDNYINGGNFNGHSVLMRVEYAKAALNIIKQNFWFGVGTGDVANAYGSYYKNSNSSLKPKYQLRGHNQYLAYGVTLGIVGFFWFLFVLFYPLITTKQYQSFLYLSFFIIISLSMLTEDTLETQIGINFFVFFNTLLLHSYNNKSLNLSA